MARPRKKGMDYFPHDTDAANDEKIELLRALYGNDGYAFYFILLERIYRTEDYELDVSDAEILQLLARKIGVDLDRFNQMLNSAIKHGCLDEQVYAQRKVLTSERIKSQAKLAEKLTRRFASKRRKRTERLYDIDVKLWRTISNQIFERDSYTCQYCGKVGGMLEVDHVVPISRGGTNDLSNLTTACRRCNRQKRDKSAEEFLEWRREHKV